VRNERGQALPPIRLRNVTAHSLGIIVRNEAGNKDVNSIIIKKDTEIPAENTEQGYTTIEDNQTRARMRTPSIAL
jgi:hypothetical protein